MNIEIPDYVQNLITELEENDYEAYVVGGAIRSALLHVEIHDYDLTTNALPQEMKQVFHQIEQLTDFLYDHHQHDNECRNSCHQRLFFPPRPLKQDIQNRHQDPNGRHFENKLYVHVSPTSA